MDRRAYVDEIGGILELEPPPLVKAQPLYKSMVAFTRLVSQRDDLGVLSIPVEDAFVIALERRTLPAVNVWLQGRHLIKDECPVGTFTFVNLNTQLAHEMNCHFDSIHMYFPRTALNAISEEQGGRKIEAFNLPFEKSTDDVVVRSLGHSVLPAF